MNMKHYISHGHILIGGELRVSMSSTLHFFSKPLRFFCQISKCVYLGQQLSKTTQIRYILKAKL